MAVRNAPGEKRCGDAEIKSKRSELTSVAMLVQNRSPNVSVVKSEVESQSAVVTAKARLLMHPVFHDSASTTPALEEEEDMLRLQEVELEEVSQCLEWFNGTFSSVGKNGRVTLKDFKRLVQECQVRLLCMHACMLGVILYSSIQDFTD